VQAWLAKRETAGQNVRPTDRLGGRQRWFATGYTVHAKPAYLLLPSPV
jgi:hypothetical protein